MENGNQDQDEGMFVKPSSLWPELERNQSGDDRKRGNRQGWEAFTILAVCFVPTILTVCFAIVVFTCLAILMYIAPIIRALSDFAF